MRQNAPNIRATLRVSLAGQEKFWGPGVAQLLHGVQRRHSLRAAAENMGISYSKAWHIVHDAERALGFELVQSRQGGVCGGGSRLTEKGERLLEGYDTMVSEMECALRAAFDKYMLPLFF